MDRLARPLRGVHQGAARATERRYQILDVLLPQRRVERRIIDAAHQPRKLFERCLHGGLGSVRYTLYP
jgi:hypothetical protein